MRIVGYRWIWIQNSICFCEHRLLWMYFLESLWLAPFQTIIFMGRANKNAALFVRRFSRMRWSFSSKARSIAKYWFSIPPGIHQHFYFLFVHFQTKGVRSVILRLKTMNLSIFFRYSERNVCCLGIRLIGCEWQTIIQRFRQLILNSSFFISFFIFYHCPDILRSFIC